MNKKRYFQIREHRRVSSKRVSLPVIGSKRVGKIVCLEKVVEGEVAVMQDRESKRYILTSNVTEMEWYGKMLKISTNKEIYKLLEITSNR